MADIEDAAECEARAARQHAFFDFEDLDDGGVASQHAAHQLEASGAPDIVVLFDNMFDELQTDSRTEAQPIFLYARSSCSNASKQLCGCYLPLCQRATLTRAVKVQIHSGLVLRGSDIRPLFVRDGLSDGENLCTGAAATGSATLFLVYDALGDGLLRVINGLSGDWCAEARSLNGPWVVRTSVAWETERDLRASYGDGRLFLNAPAANVPLEVQLPPTPCSRAMHLPARVICLSERRPNAEWILQELADLSARGSLDVDAKIVDACDTRGFDLLTLVQGGLIDAENFEHGSQLLGCALSHSKLWAALAAGEGAEGLTSADDMLLVLEDDAVLNTARPLHLMLPAVLHQSSAIDWDLILLGASANNAWHENCSANWPSQWATDSLVHIKFFMGFWGYLIRRRGARRALYSLWGDVANPSPLTGDCDCCVAEATFAGQIEALLCVPHLVLHPYPETKQRTRCCFLDYEYRVDLNCKEVLRTSGGHSARAAMLDQDAELEKDGMGSVEEMQLAIRMFRELATAPLQHATRKVRHGMKNLDGHHLAGALRPAYHRPNPGRPYQ